MSLNMLTYEVAADGAPEDSAREAKGPERRDKGVSPAKMKALRKIAQTAVDAGTVFGTAARLGPATVRLTTNEYEIFHLWRQNWPAADIDTDTRPDGAVVAAVGLEQQESAAYYCRQNGQVTLLNVNDYAECRNWALSMAADYAAANGRAGLQAAAVELDGRGTVIACRDAALLAATAAVLALDYGAAVQNLAWSWLSASDGDEPAAAHKAELTAFLPPESQRWEPRLGALAGGCSLSGLAAAGTRAMPVQQFVLLEPEPDAEEASCEPVSPVEALGALRKGQWATPQLALPVHPAWRPTLEAALQQARCARAVIAGAALRPLCRRLMESLEQARG